jgi:glutaredoxin-like protein NrdH
LSIACEWYKLKIDFEVQDFDPVFRQQRLFRNEVMQMAKNHVKGEKKGNLMLYALSTCVWCKKTKALLESLNVDFYYTDVDLLSGQERTDAMEEIKTWNPLCSFPTLVVDKGKCIVGYDEKKIREAIKHGG